jgi:phenylalanyl-tRNA synthetase alpha subunit
LANFNIKNGSNIHSLLENLEKIVKDKQYHKLAKSLSEAKRDIHVKVSDNSEKINKIENVEFNKLKEYDMKIPNLKYDFAEKILINNQKMINHDNYDE